MKSAFQFTTFPYSKHPLFPSYTMAAMFINMNKENSSLFHEFMNKCIFGTNLTMEEIDKRGITQHAEHLLYDYVACLDGKKYVIDPSNEKEPIKEI